jgi:hypothetical protein
MRVNCLVVGLAALLLPRGAAAQTIDPRCPANTANALAAQDACIKALDLFNFLAPQLSTGLTGGNAVSGEYSTLRGGGHFSLGMRVNAIRGRVIDVEQVTASITGAVASDYSTEETAIPVPTADVALGVLRGFPIGGSYAFGVDLLANLSYIPEINVADVSVTAPNGSFKLAYGVRVGIVEETIATPGIVVTYLKRDLPQLDIVGRSGADSLSVSDFIANTSAWRVVVGKSLGILGVAVGAGQERYQTSATAAASVRRGAQTYNASLGASQKLLRDNLFANMSLNFPFVRVVAEVGRTSGGDPISTFNTFSGARPTDALQFASVGLRFRW